MSVGERMESGGREMSVGEREMGVERGRWEMEMEMGETSGRVCMSVGVSPFPRRSGQKTLRGFLFVPSVKPWLRAFRSVVPRSKPGQGRGRSSRPVPPCGCRQTGKRAETEGTQAILLEAFWEGG